jgi:hypothetical protein
VIRNLLWTVSDGGATYWVSATSREAAIKLVLRLPDRDPNEVDAEETSREDRERLRFRFEDGETCRLGNAFELVREHDACVLSCSEWP